MCGISGIVTFDHLTPEHSVLEGMSDRIAHRGPDGRGIWLSEGVGMAHCRLAVLDLSERGSQPMHSKDGRYTVVYNGEVYNYKELQKDLCGPWESTSDTEVILRGYEVHGEAFFAKLRGMFALVIWDSKDKRLILARDPIGKKPLFWSRALNGDVYFASEIKALKGCVPFNVDWGAIRSFIGLQYVPSPKTGFIGIQQLEPGTLATFDVHGCHEKKYHTWENTFSRVITSSADEIEKAIRAKLEKAVAIRQIASDVPVGAFLSGGIDSAAIVAYASKYSERPLQTFTMGFPDIGMDERENARKISEILRTDHYEFEARPEHIIDLLDTLVTHYDIPYADSSSLPTWLLAQKTAKQIKVILTGDGGDEAFGGYRRYKVYNEARNARFLPVVHAASFAGLVMQDSRFLRFSDAVRGCRISDERGYAELFCGSYFGTRGAEALLTESFLQETKEYDGVAYIVDHMARSRSVSNRGALDRAMFFDLTSYLADDLNVKMDRAAMAFGLEARSPFLDQDVIEYALQLPIHHKVAYGTTKASLRRALKGILPDSVLRRKKMGFQIPLAAWFRGPLRSIFEERCLSKESPLFAFMNQDEIRRLFIENNRGLDHGNRLWMLVTLSTWLKNQNV